MRIGDPVVYCPVAGHGHYRAKVTKVRSTAEVDIEIPEQGNDSLQLRCIAVVPTLRDLVPASCTADPGESDGKS